MGSRLGVEQPHRCRRFTTSEMRQPLEDVAEALLLLIEDDERIVRVFRDGDVFRCLVYTCLWI
jgi:hypothetical protein